MAEENGARKHSKADEEFNKLIVTEYVTVKLMQETKQTYEDANQSQSETTNTINELECESAVYEGEAYEAGRKVNKESLKRFRKKYAENRDAITAKLIDDHGDEAVGCGEIESSDDESSNPNQLNCSQAAEDKPTRDKHRDESVEDNCNYQSIDNNHYDRNYRHQNRSNHKGPIPNCCHDQKNQQNTNKEINTDHNNINDQHNKSHENH